MKAEKMLTPVQQAYAKLVDARKVLRELDAQCMEEVTDKCGIVVLRYFVLVTPPNAERAEAVNVILYATPMWWDVFTPVTPSDRKDATLQAIRDLRK